ncbi:hypothetical protein [Ferroacidibacillus organovorans]|uniref:hypothetical protein n=1 Tax=Ferroacidibacillus organovorans TaxID=1765683 RepID=UPI0012E77BAF|nr:hypothetical protein [Ferroacidibacillus organovorans]
MGQSTVSQWIAALKGDPSYVTAHLWNTTFIDSAGQPFSVSNVSQIVEMSGAAFVPNSNGDWFNQPVYATDPPKAQITIVGSDSVQQGKSLKFKDHAFIEAYHTNYHFEWVTVKNASGVDVTSESFNENSLQGKAPYNGETLYASNGAPMVEVQGGGATTYPPSFVETTDGGSTQPNEIDTKNLSPGHYVIKLEVKDWFNRAATSATVDFTVIQAPSPPQPPLPPPTPPSPPSGPTCPNPTIPPMPANEVLSYNWSPDGTGGQMLTWTDTHWQLQTTSDSDGCTLFEWVDSPITYHHDYPLNLSNFQVTGLFYDPGQPGDVWSPTNPTASQQNSDAYSDGSTDGGNQALPTYGNPTRSPSIYVRVGGGVAFRLEWTGSPHDMPSRANVTFQLVNPDGDTNVWTKAFPLLSDTIFNQGDVPVWDPNGNGFPPPATEVGWVYTSIPKYATTGVPKSFSQLTAWNVSGDRASSAHLGTSVSFITGEGSTVTWNDADFAQTLGYPTWYYLHQIPDATAKYEQSQPTWNRMYTTESLPKLGSLGQLVPTIRVSGP